MDFKMENFQIGINENGFHFRDSETGVIFSLLKVRSEKLDLAICYESAPRQVCDALGEFLKRQTKRFGVRISSITEISLEECYISKNQNAFQLFNFCEDSIGICYKESKKIIGLTRIDGGVPVIGLDLPDFYDAEEAVRNFFKLCESSMQEIKLNISASSVKIKRKYVLRTIKSLLLKCAVEGKKDECLSKCGRPQYKETEAGDFEAYIDEFNYIDIYRDGEYYVVNATHESYPIFWFIHLIEAVKTQPNMDIIEYIYINEDDLARILITKKNANRILKEAIRKKRISLFG